MNCQQKYMILGAQICANSTSRFIVNLHKYQSFRVQQFSQNEINYGRSRDLAYLNLPGRGGMI